MSVQPEHTTRHYDRIHYRCTECGESEVYEGLPVKERNPVREESDCTMCTMRLVQPERYWSGELVADRIDVWSWPTASGPSRTQESANENERGN